LQNTSIGCSSVGSNISSDGKIAGCDDFEPEYTEEEMAKLEPQQRDTFDSSSTLSDESRTPQEHFKAFFNRIS